MTNKEFVMPEVTTSENGIPVIKNLWQEVLRAVKYENHILNMSAWHGNVNKKAECDPFTKKGKLRKVVQCETTHCIAGWIIHLAGEQGYELQQVYGYEQAANMIIGESIDIRFDQFGFALVDFYTTERQAMEQLKKMAELEKETNA